MMKLIKRSDSVSKDEKQLLEDIEMLINKPVEVLQVSKRTYEETLETTGLMGTAGDMNDVFALIEQNETQEKKKKKKRK